MRSQSGFENEVNAVTIAQLGAGKLLERVSIPIPAFTQHGLLPEGIHDCTLAEGFEALCFDAQRELIWGGLLEFLAWIDPLPAPDSILLDGSFVTDKIDPRDLDVVIEITSCSEAQQTEWVNWWTNGHGFAKDNFNVDFYPFAADQGNDFSVFFQYLRVEEALRRGLVPMTRKGILRTVQ